MEVRNNGTRFSEYYKWEIVNMPHIIMLNMAY